jgi:preprotein translocase subunit YajC
MLMLVVVMVVMVFFWMSINTATTMKGSSKMAAPVSGQS